MVASQTWREQLHAGFWVLGDPGELNFKLFLKTIRRIIIERKFTNLFVPLGSILPLLEASSFFPNEGEVTPSGLEAHECS